MTSRTGHNACIPEFILHKFQQSLVRHKDLQMTMHSTLRCNNAHQESLASWQVQQNLFPAVEFHPKRPEEDASDKDNKNVKNENVHEFTMPLDLQESDDKTCDCFVQTFDPWTPEQCCSMREKVEGLAA